MLWEARENSKSLNWFFFLQVWGFVTLWPVWRPWNGSRQCEGIFPNACHQNASSNFSWLKTVSCTMSFLFEWDSYDPTERQKHHKSRYWGGAEIANWLRFFLVITVFLIKGDNQVRGIADTNGCIFKSPLISWWLTTIGLDLAIRPASLCLSPFLFLETYLFAFSGSENF